MRRACASNVMPYRRVIMTDHNLLGPWVRRFLLEYLVTERNLARNTQQSYRDTLCLLIPFLALHAKKEVHELAVIDVSAFCNIWSSTVSAAWRHETSDWLR